MANTLIQNATVIDGSGKQRIVADLLIRDTVIADIGKRLNTTGVETIINAKEQFLCPGFIDPHTHSDMSLLAAPDALGKISQGVTTDIAGNCGLSLFPITDHNREHLEQLYKQYNMRITWNTLADYIQEYTKRQPAINLASLTGHNTLRAAVGGYEKETLTQTEICECRKLLKQSLGQGSLGFSTGLLYIPGKFSSTEELSILVSELKNFGATYSTHLRSEGATLLEALAEALSICRHSNHNKLHISHLKTSGKVNWHKIDKLLETIHNSNTEELRITADRYPYTESMTQLSIILPSPYDCMTSADLKNHLADAANFTTFEKAMATISDERWSNVRLVSTLDQTYRHFAGYKFIDIAGRCQKPAPTICAGILLNDPETSMAAFSGMSPDNLKRIILQDYTCCGSDESARSLDYQFGTSHPRGFGSFPRFINLLKNDLSWESIIHKITALPAAIFSLPKRGMICKGNYADLVLFDPDKLNDNATFADPHQLSDGILRVWVNGTLSYQEKAATKNKAGQFIVR